MGVLFGAGPVMDAFTVAFRLPNLARVLLGEGALTTAFLPVFLADLNERGKDSAARVTWAVFVSLAFLPLDPVEVRRCSRAGRPCGSPTHGLDRRIILGHGRPSILGRTHGRGRGHSRDRPHIATADSNSNPTPVEAE